MRRLLCIAMIALSACTQFPELDATIPPQAQAADFPALVPLEPLLASRSAIVGNPAEVSQSLTGRVNALKSRARALQQRAIVDRPTRARLQQAMG